jgi:hypothetical protein
MSRLPNHRIHGVGALPTIRTPQSGFDQQGANQGQWILAAFPSASEQNDRNRRRGDGARGKETECGRGS